MNAHPGDDHAGPGDDEELPSEIALAPHRPPVWAPLTLVAFVALVVCTNIANVVWARWAGRNPEGLLALSSRNRYLVASVGGFARRPWRPLDSRGRRGG